MTTCDTRSILRATPLVEACQNMPYTALPVDGQWIVPHTRDQLLGACAANLRARGAEPDMVHLAAHIENFRNQNGEYVERTEYSLEMLIWQIS